MGFLIASTSRLFGLEVCFLRLPPELRGVAIELLGVNSIVEVLDWDRRTLIAFISLCL